LTQSRRGRRAAEDITVVSLL